MISSSSGMLPAWLCVFGSILSFAVMGYLIGVLRERALIQREQKQRRQRELELLETRRIGLSIWNISEEAAAEELILWSGCRLPEER